MSWLPGTNISSDFGEDSLNCTLGAGAAYAVDLDKPVPLTECFSLCRADPKCEAIRVDWFSLPANWTAFNVGCGLRGGIDVANCGRMTPYDPMRPHTVPYTTFSVDAPVRSQMVVATTALSGHLPVVRNSGNDW